jgi:hypothetical protein
VAYSVSHSILDTCDHIDLADKLPLKQLYVVDRCETNLIPSRFSFPIPRCVSAIMNESYVFTIFWLSVWRTSTTPDVARVLHDVRESTAVQCPTRRFYSDSGPRLRSLGEHRFTKRSIEDSSVYSASSLLSIRNPLNFFGLTEQMPLGTISLATNMAGILRLY